MPRNGSGIYALPAGVVVTDGVDDILASQLNDATADFAADANDPRPIVAGGTGADNEEDARANLALDGSTVLSSYGGTANAITLTTGLSLSALVAGMKFSFIPSAANTAATTATIDGLTAVDCKTVTGEDLPNGYIRNGVLTEGYFDGTDLILDRKVEYGSSSDGRYWKYADGQMKCRETQSSATFNITTADGSNFRSGDRGWTFPATFNVQPVVNIIIDAEGCWWTRASGAGGTHSTTSIQYRVYQSTSGSVSSIEIELEANGYWY